MLIKLLPESEQMILLDLCKLLTLSDNPLMWGNKSYEQITSDTDLSSLIITIDEQENSMLEELEQSITRGAVFNFGISKHLSQDVESMLIEKLKSYPITQVNQSTSRANAALAVQRKLLADVSTKNPEVPKIMIYELQLVALKDGTISNIEMALLQDIKQHFKVPDYVFDDLLVRAQALNTELSKTLAIILE